MGGPVQRDSVVPYTERREAEELFKFKILNENHEGFILKKAFYEILKKPRGFPRKQ